MKLTIEYDGTPDTAKIVCREHGHELENVRSFSLQRDDPRGVDVLTVSVLITPVKGQGAKGLMISDIE